MGNNNCLLDKRCPCCGYEDKVIVAATVMVELSDDGTDPDFDSSGFGGGTEYDEDSAAVCPKCGHAGNFGDWDYDAAPRALCPSGVPSSNNYVDRCQQTLND